MVLLNNTTTCLCVRSGALLTNNSAGHCERTTGPNGFKPGENHLHRVQFPFSPLGNGGITYSIIGDTIVFDTSVSTAI